jgi:hypothetical protein
MVQRFIKFLKKSRYALVSGVFVLAMAGAGVAALVQPTSYMATASAASCDPVNIVRCGLNGSDLSGYVSSFKGFYNTGHDAYHSDLKAVYNWSGANQGAVSQMNTTNTKLGTMYRNGDIKVGGKVVAHDSWISARFGAGRDGFVHVEGDVWARKTTTSMAEASTQVIVHFNAYNEVTFAVMVHCGNAVKTTPVPTKPELNCIILTAKVLPDRDRVYTFTAKASAKNTTITSYDFNFGDGHTFSRHTSAEVAQVVHGYAHAGTTYHADVTVHSTRTGGVTSPACHVTINTPAAPALACENLTVAPIDGQLLTYGFTATASADHTTITKYVFDFGDGVKKEVDTSKTTATIRHAYGQYDHRYTATVTVFSKDFPNGVTSKACQATFTTPQKPTHPQLACVNLTANEEHDTLTYDFKAVATAKDTTITKYVFDFGDGSHQAINTDQETATTSHSYSKYDTKYTATVTVFSKDFPGGVTSKACQATFTTPQKPVKPALECDQLTATPVKGQDLSYTFTGTASAEHTTITNYVFDFGDGHSKNVNTDQETATADHTYDQYNHTYTATVTVFSKDFPKGVSSKNCEATFTTPKKPAAPQLTCVQLTATPVAGQAFTYTFTATASAQHTTITAYTFNFGDGTNQQVTTDQETATTPHTYANNTQQYVASVTVYSTDFPQGVTAQACQITFPPQVCTPGTPTTNSGEQCTTPVPPCQPGVPTTQNHGNCQLPNTGPGNIIGFVGATTLVGGLLHRFFLRRKMSF